MKIKEIKIVNQDESTEIADIGADAQNVDYNNTTVKDELDKLNEDNDENKDDITSLQNELDETDSTLTSLESTLSKKPYYYDSVADMKVDNKLKAGDMAITLGYYEIGDCGGAEYIITNNDNEGNISYSINNSNLYATLIIKENMNSKQFGIKGDGVTDETILINNIIANSKVKKIIFNSQEEYLLSDFSIASNKIIDLNNSTIIITEENGKVSLNSISNVTLMNGTIKSNIDRDNFLSDPNLSLVKIINSNNIILKNLTIDYAITDGIILGRPSGSGHNENIYIDHCITKSVGRNGFAITDGKNVYVTNCEFSNAKKWIPRLGIDLEPNFIDDKLENIYLNNNYTHDNGFGSIGITTLRTATSISIFVNNHLSNNDNTLEQHFNIVFANDHTLNNTSVTHNDGIISINNYKCFNCSGFPIGIYGNKSDEIKFIVDNCDMNCATPNIRWYGTLTQEHILGNVEIKGNFNKDIGFFYNCSHANDKYKNIIIENKNYNITPVNETNGTTSFEKVFLELIYNYTAPQVSTMIYDGAQGTSLNQWGDITITKLGTGKYQITNLGRGAWITSLSGYKISLALNGLVQVYNSSGSLVDDTLYIFHTKPSGVGQMYLRKTIS